MDPWSIPEFRTGLGAGTVATLVLLAIGAVAGRRSCPLPVGGVAVAAAGVWTLSRARPVPAVLLLAVLGVAAVAAGRARWRWSLATSLAPAVPFALAAGFHTGVPGASWVRVLVVVVASAGALLAAECDHGWRDLALGPPLLGLSLLGVYATVPDTEEAAGLLAAALPVVALGWPLHYLALGTGGAAGTTVLLAWTAAVGGVGRPASIVGACACLGLLVGLPLGRRLTPVRTRPGVLDRLGPPAVAPAALLVHLVLVAAGSRLAGLRDEVTVAASISAVVLVSAVVFGSILGQVRAGAADGPDPPAR